MPASSSGESGLNESEKVASLRALLLCAPPRINPAPYGAHLALCLTSSTALGRILRPMLERSMRPMLANFSFTFPWSVYPLRLLSALTLCAYSLRLSTMCALFLDPHLALRRVIAHLWSDFLLLCRFACWDARLTRAQNYQEAKLTMGQE